MLLFCSRVADPHSLSRGSYLVGQLHVELVLPLGVPIPHQEVQERHELPEEVDHHEAEDDESETMPVDLATCALALC